MRTLEQAGLDRADIDWAIRILKGRNDKSLPALLDELAASTGELGEQILAQLPNFGKRVADARVGVSHPIARGVGSLPLHWLGEVLSWIVRVRLLTSANVPLDLPGGEGSTQAATRAGTA